MSAEQDDDEGGLDDAQLRGMRSVWRSMRDDDAEPSRRGMADLLAAARAQVAAGRPKPAWQRALTALGELLRRPPVLALATVVLVAGTAVLVQSHGGMTAQDTAVAPAPPAAVATPTQLPPALVATPDVDTPVAAPAAAAPAPVAPPSSAASPTHVLAGATRRGPAPGAMGAAMQSSGKAAQPTAPNEVAVDADRELEEQARARKPAPPPQSLAAPDDGPAAASPAAISPAAVSPAAISPAAISPAAISPANDQLLRECYAAAARGDCDAVRKLADRVRAQDAAYYRSTLSRDPQLTGCLFPTAR